MPASVIHLRSVSVLTAIWCHSSSFSRASVGPKSRSGAVLVIGMQQPVNLTAAEMKEFRRLDDA